MKFSANILIERPREIVWQVFTNPTTWVTWWGGELKSVEPDWQAGGRMIWALGSPSKISEYTPGRVTLLGSGDVRTTFVFEDAGNGQTIMTYHEDYDGASVSVNDPARRQAECRATVANLKKYVENFSAIGEPVLPDNKTASPNIIQQEASDCFTFPSMCCSCFTKHGNKLWKLVGPEEKWVPQKIIKVPICQGCKTSLILIKILCYFLLIFFPICFLIIYWDTHGYVAQIAIVFVIWMIFFPLIKYFTEPGKILREIPLTALEANIGMIKFRNKKYQAKFEDSKRIALEHRKKINMLNKQYFSVHCPYCGDLKLYEKSTGVVHCDNKDCPNGEKPVDIDRYNLRRLIFR